MKKKFSIHSILSASLGVCALLGILVAGQAQGAVIRYKASGDYNATTNSTANVNGWQTTGALPGAADDARFNWGGTAGNIVTLTNEAPLIKAFQMGVDESGALVVTNGGKLVTTNTSTIGAACTGSFTVTGKLTVYTGGQVVVTNVLQLGNNGTAGKPVVTGILTINGGTVDTTSHVWIGCGTATNKGLIYLTNGGTLNVGGNIGLGTINGTDPRTNCTGSVYVQDGGVLNLKQISPTNSIQPGSLLDISGSGAVIVTNDYVTAMSYFTNVGRITAYGGLGTVGIDYNNTNAGKTTLWAIAPLVGPPTNCVWNPALNVGDTNGLWNVSSNWNVGQVPASITKVQFNVTNAIPCIVTNAAVAAAVVMGDNGPGGTLIITNGGSLTVSQSSQPWSAIGYSGNAVLAVESGASVNFANQLWVGFTTNATGTLIMNGGTVTVGGPFGLGYHSGGDAGTGTALIHGGQLNLASAPQFQSIAFPGSLGSGLLDIASNGVVVINGDQRVTVNYEIGVGLITNSTGAGLVVDYNNVNVGKTTIYAADNSSITLAQTTWNPVNNNPSDPDGLWNVSTNWDGGIVPGSVTTAKFNVLDAIPCTVTNAASAGRIVMGESSGPGGTLIITNGASLTVGASSWSAIAYSSNALMRVESGCAVSFGFQLWIGFNLNSDGTLIINGGTVSVTDMIGLGWNGGKGTVQVNNGTLNLAQWNDTQSIQGASVLDVVGTGKVYITGDHLTSVSNYISAGKITANGGPTVYYAYNSGTNITTVSATPLALPPPPAQSISSVVVGGGNVSLTYETTAGNTYHIEATPSLAPATWATVPGSTTNATGAPITFVTPIVPGTNTMFYRTVSP